VNTFEAFLDYQESETGKRPATKWAICSSCRGDGTSTRYLGDVTQMIAEDPDFGEDYWRGVYDRACDDCDGTGKVRVLADESVAAEWDEWLAEEAADRAVRRAESGYAW